MSPENPYHAPDARLADAPVRMDVPEEITGPIKHGWVAATISGLFTLARCGSCSPARPACPPACSP